MKNSKREKADKILDNVTNYLEQNHWKIHGETFKFIDPLTNLKYHTLKAFEIQLDRDMS